MVSAFPVGNERNPKVNGLILGLLNHKGDPMANFGKRSNAQDVGSKAHDYRLFPRFPLGDDEGFCVLGSEGRRSQGVKCLSLVAIDHPASQAQ
jgi:hypothetical protein